MSQRQRHIALGAGALLLLILLWVLWPRGASEAETRAMLDYLIAAETEAEWPGLDVDTAATTLETPEAAADFLRTGVALQDYSGRHANPDTVLITRGGNAEDQAMLLQALIEAQGHQTRLRASDWPADDVPRLVLSEPRERPAHDALMAFLELDVESARAAAAQESSDRFARLGANTARAMDAARTHGALATVPGSVRPDRHVLVEYRANGQWITLDPVLETPVPGSLQDYAPPEITPIEIRLELVTGQGERRELAQHIASGPEEVTLSFVPASGLNAFFDGAPDPTGVPLWRPVIQQGEAGVAGEVFTPGGRQAPIFDTPPAIGEPPDVSELAILGVDVSSFPEVVLTVSGNAPADTVWSAAHLGLIDGATARPVRVEALPTEPREITFVTDISPSMVEGSRVFTAGLLGQSIIRQLDPYRSFAAVSVAGEVQVDRAMTTIFQPWAGIDDYDPGLTIRPGDNLVEGARVGLARFWSPGDLIILTDGEISDEDLDGLAEVTEAAGARHRVFAVVPDTQVVRFTPMVDRVFTLPNDEGDIPDTARAIINSTGSQLRVSFLAEPGDGDLARTLTLSVRDRDVSAQADYVPLPRPDGAGRIELSVWRGGEPLGQARTLVELGQPDTAWRLMSRHKVFVSGGRFDAEAFARRFYADERFAWQMALEDETAALPVGPLLSMLSAAQAVSGYTELALSARLTGSDLQAVLFSASADMDPGGDLYFNRTLDLLSDGGLSAAGGARAALAIAEAEAEFLGVESISARVLGEAEPAVVDPRTQIPADWPRETVRTLAGSTATLVATSDGQAGWLITPQGDLIARLFTPAAKGANARRAAAEFQPLIKALSITGTVASGLGSPYGVNGAEVGALFGILDFDVRMYCYSSVMMGFVADTIETGDYGTEDWEAYASEQCGIDPSNAMSAFVGSVAKGAAYGWAGDQFTNYTKGPTGDALTHWQEVGVNTGAGFVIPFLGDLGIAGVELASRRPDALPSQVIALGGASAGSESISNRSQTEP